MFHFLRDIPLALLRTIGEFFEWIFLSAVPELDMPMWKRILYLPLLVPYWIFRFVLAVIKFPFVGFQFEGQRHYHFLLGLPALLGIVLTLAIALYNWVTEESVTQHYLQKMQEAIQKEDFRLASTIGGRLMSDTEKGTPELALNYAMILSKLGENAKATTIINSLAPDNLSGFAPAHQLRAVQIAQTLGTNASIDDLEKLYWHLSKSGDPDNEQLLMIWVAYYERVGQLDEAIKKEERLAKLNSAYLRPLSDLYRKAGNTTEANKILALARDNYIKILNANPLDKITRIQLALSLAKLNKVDEAEKVLQNGLAISKDPVILRALADFYLYKYESASVDLAGVKDSIKYLERAIRLDPTYVQTYDKLVQLYQRNQESEHRDDIIKILEELIVEGKNAAVAHFALSNVFLIDGKKELAMTHLKQAFQLSPTMAVVCNNMAWMMANTDPPQLDEALELAQQAVKEAPSSAEFRATLGTILLLQGNYLEATKELELALAEIPDNKSLHERLARAYKGLGSYDIAKLHEEKSK